jgi:urease accessory protein
MCSRSGFGGCSLGSPALWMLLIVFPLVMKIGGTLCVLGVPLPGAEIGIAWRWAEPRAVRASC